MKFRILILSLLVAFSFSSQAQVSSIFKPLPKPRSFVSFNGATLASDSISNSIRPIVNVTASVSNGASLAGGVGIGFQHNKWDVASQSWLTVYSVSAVGFLGTNGSKITGTGAVIFGIPGTNGLIGIGPGYDFTNGVWVLMTGVQIKFN